MVHLHHKPPPALQPGQMIVTKEMLTDSSGETQALRLEGTTTDSQGPVEVREALTSGTTKSEIEQFDVCDAVRIKFTELLDVTLSAEEMADKSWYEIAGDKTTILHLLEILSQQGEKSGFNRKSKAYQALLGIAQKKVNAAAM